MKTKRNGMTQQFLALAVLSAEVLGPLLCVAAMLGGGQMLPAWQKLLYVAAGDIIALGCLTVYFCLWHPAEQSGFQKIRRNWLAVLQEELWILVIFCLWMAMDEIRELLCGNFFPDSVIWNIAVPIALSCAALLAISLFTDRLIRKYVLTRTGKSKKRLLKSFCVSTAALVIWIGVYAIKEWVLEPRVSSVSGMLALHIFDACCGYGILAAMLHVLCRDKEAEAGKSAEDTPLQDRDEIPREDAGGMKPRFKVFIPLAIAALLGFFMGGRGDIAAQERMRASIEDSLADGYEALREGNMERAAAAFDLSAARAHAFAGIVEENSGYSLDNIYDQYPDDVVIGVLYLSAHGSIQQLEGRIRNHTLGMEWYPALLRYYGGLEEQTGEQKLLQEEMLLKLAAAECYTEGALFAEDLTDEKMAAVSLLNGYEEELAACSMFRLMVPGAGIQPNWRKRRSVWRRQIQTACFCSI